MATKEAVFPPAKEGADVLTLTPYGSRLFAKAPGTDKVVVTAAASVNNFTEFTMMAWLKVASYPAQGDFGLILTKVSPIDGITGKAFYLFKGDLGDGVLPYLVTFLSSNGETNAAQSAVDITSLLPIGEWVHVAMTFSQLGSQEAFFYFNGIAAGSYTVQQAATDNLDADAAFDFVVGAEGAYKPVDGRVFDARYYNSVLSESEILAIVSGGPTVDPESSSNRCQLTFAANVGSPEPDASGNGNTGVITGTTFAIDAPFLGAASDDILIGSYLSGTIFQLSADHATVIRFGNATSISDPTVASFPIWANSYARFALPQGCDRFRLGLTSATATKIWYWGLGKA